jgi:hypothetical protein
MKIAVFGDKSEITYNEFDLLVKEKITSGDEVICGSPSHINKLSELWAKRNRIKREILNIDFKKCGRNASYYNKRKIISECDVCYIVGSNNNNYAKFCEEFNKKVEFLEFS